MRVDKPQFPGGAKRPGLQERIVGTERRQQRRPRVSAVDRRRRDPDTSPRPAPPPASRALMCFEACS